MRLFFAILLEEAVKDSLFDGICTMRGQCVRGNFTKKENLHLTLEFIGETDRVNQLKELLKTLEFPAFSLTTSAIGKFRRSGGDLYWLGLKHSEELQAVHSQLNQILRQAGFPLQQRSYTPHLTLGREVIIGERFDQQALEALMSGRTSRVTEVSLMRSSRVDGRLVYTQIAIKEASV